MWEIEKDFRVRLGGNTYINCDQLVSFQDSPLFTLRRHDETGYLGIDFNIYGPDGKLIAKVKRNEIYQTDFEGHYRLDGSGDRCTLTDTIDGSILCDIRKRADAHPAELDVSVKLYTPSGVLFDATPDETNLLGSIFSDCTFQNCGVGIAIT